MSGNPIRGLVVSGVIALIGAGGPSLKVKALSLSRAPPEQLFQSNCSFQKVEMFPDRIGYVKFDAFLPPAICGPTAAAAMGFVAVAFIASDLFDWPTHLTISASAMTTRHVSSGPLPTRKSESIH